MSRFFKIALAFALILQGCGPAEEKEPAHNVPDSDQDMSELDMSELDMPDMENGSDMSSLACGLLDTNPCFQRPDCAWGGSSCHDLTGTRVDFFQAASTVSSGVITLGAHAELENSGDRPTQVMLVRTGDAIHGSLAVSQDSGDQIFPLRGEVDFERGSMEMRLLVARCLVESGESCDAVVPALDFAGKYVNGQWVFPAPTLAAGLPSVPSFIQNFRFQPNDGIKPSMVREQSFVAQLFSVFNGNPLAASTICNVTFTGTLGEPETELSTFVCGQDDLKIVADSFALVQGRMWFQFETDGDPITFIGWDDGRDIGGVLVRDPNKYFQSAQRPISLEDVDVEDIVGSLILEPGGAVVR